MDDSYSNGLERITNDFNDRYGNISGIDKMYYMVAQDNLNDIIKISWNEFS